MMKLGFNVANDYMENGMSSWKTKASSAIDTVAGGLVGSILPKVGAFLGKIPGVEKLLTVGGSAFDGATAQWGADSADAFWLKPDEFQWDWKTEVWRGLISGTFDQTAAHFFPSGVKPGFTGNPLHLPSYKASSIAAGGWTNWGTIFGILPEYKRSQASGGSK